MREELHPSTRKVHSEIITDLSHKSKVVFLIMGLEHLEIMKKLDVNYVIYKSFDTLKYSSTDEILALKKALQDFKPFFISTNKDDFISALKLYTMHFQKIVKRLHLIDLEVLKAVELISADELLKHDYILGLELPKEYKLSDYMNEVKEEARHKPLDLYTYLKNLLYIETQRIINAR